MNSKNIELHAPGSESERGPWLLDGRMVYVRCVVIDMLAWHKAGKPVREIIDAQGFLLARFGMARYDEQSCVWEFWIALCPGGRATLTKFKRKWPQWISMEALVEVPLSHRAYLPKMG